MRHPLSPLRLADWPALDRESLDGSARFQIRSSAKVDWPRLGGPPPFGVSSVDTANISLGWHGRDCSTT